MKENIVEYYFSLVKLGYIFTLIIYCVAANGSFNYVSDIMQVGLLLCFTSLMVIYEIFHKRHIVLLIASLVICMVLSLYLNGSYCVLMPLVILDFIEYFKLSRWLYLAVFLILIFKKDIAVLYFIACVSTMIIYLQHYCIVKWYKAALNNFIDNEQNLKTYLELQKVQHKKEVQRSSLEFENKFLQEKSRLSQALHDKIGHSINGSVYQLEAAKLLIDRNSQESKSILQAVINNLRSSLDEIRAILRKEKPNKGQMALMQLRNLCEDFKKNYSINAALTLNGDIEVVPEPIWEVVLDNSIEAFSNALKYSECKSITVDIIILNKLLRCKIADDGNGCSNVVSGMGLAGMKERVRTVNGSISIVSELGFEINMLLPIR